MNKMIVKPLLNKTKQLFRWAFLLSPFGLFFIICLDTYMVCEAEDKTFQNVTEISYNKVGLLLGTSKFLSNGSINPYYLNRLEAANALYKSGKIDFILISGDNGNISYNEPALFKKDLIEKGIPESKIFLDYAGFSTLDSVIRAQKIFGLSSFTVISQKFHNERAIFLAKQNSINAIAFNAKTVSGKFALKTELREYLARTKAYVDILFNSQPKYLGEKITIR